jgi:outer membrane receptor protein involved in Fe transport
MQRKLLFLLLITALVPGLMFASGKIRGKVVDATSGEPLVGANVVVVGTSMGAATNVSGEYTVLNVPAGTFQLRTTYVGYQAITISNIRVNNDLTTEANFQLPGEGVTVATVEIVAERPLVNKSATNAVRIIDQEFFDKIPARGTNAAIVVQPGVVTLNGNIYIRGGRPDEVGFKVEGVGVNNIVHGGQALHVVAEAVEQMQVQAGGFNAEYGGANAGLVQTGFRSGSPDAWKASLLEETDNFTKQNKKALGGFSYGYNDLTGTVGGPILGKKLRFFGSFENTFYRDPSQAVRGPYDFTGANALISDPTYTFAHPPVPGSSANSRPDTISASSAGGNAVGGGNNLWVTSGTLLLDLGDIQVRGSGSYSYNKYQDQAFFTALLDQARLPMHDNKDGFANIRLSHALSPTMFYEVNFNYFNNVHRDYDPIFGSNVFAYGDSAQNAAHGFYLQNESLNWTNYSFYGGAFAMNQPGAVLSGYNYEKETSLGGRADFTAQVKQHEIKFGGEYTRYTIRRYNPNGVLSWSQIAKQYGYGSQTAGDLLRKIGGVGSDTYGYDIWGNQIENDVITNGALSDLGPRKPTFAAAYIQDKIELADVVLNLGLRLDYIDPASKDAPDPGGLHFNNNDLILASDIVNTSKTTQISPRIGFSFPVSDRTVFHAQYGKFIQQTQLRDSYLGITQIAGIIKGGFFDNTPVGWGLKPTRTTQYELGFAQQVSDFASFDITAFYKDIQDQIQFTYILPDPGSPNANYSSLVNGDFTTSKGIEFKFTLRRTNRIQAQINYTFSDVKTTGSNPASVSGIWSAGSIVDYPHYVFPADFDFPNKGNVLLDYRFAKGDGGSILEQSGLNLLLSFNSGHAMTRLDASQRGPNPTDPRFRTPIEPIGASSTPWFFQLDARIDKAVRIGPLDTDFYIYVENLLNTDNAVNAFIRTADPNNDGWFASPSGKADATSNGPAYVRAYNQLLLGANSGNFSIPRMIRFGVKLDY